MGPTSTAVAWSPTSSARRPAHDPRGGATPANAQGAHRLHAGAAALAKTKLTKHERRESTVIRAGETSSNDPASSGPNEPSDSSANDPSPRDEGAGDTSSNDSNDTTDQASLA